MNILVHEISYTITFIVINNNLLDFSYSMLLRCPWLKDIVTIQGTIIIKTIHVIKKLGVQTKKL
jgi:hypothetical protein